MIRLLSLLCSFGLTAVSAHAAICDISKEDNAASKVRDHIMAWSNSIKSFDVEYRCVQHDEHDEISFDWTIVHRWQPPSWYVSVIDAAQLGKNGPTGEVHTFHQGANESMNVGAIESYGLTQSKGKSELPFPDGAYATPRDIFGFRSGKSLEDFLSTASLSIVERPEGCTLLAVTPETGISVDVTLGLDDRVSEIVFGRRPTGYSSEQIKEMWGRDSFDVRKTSLTLELNDYIETDGVWYPTNVVRTVWQVDEAEVISLNARFDSGAITQEQLAVEIYDLRPHQFVRQTVTLQKASLNKVLPDSDFRIQWPEGVKVYDANDPKLQRPMHQSTSYLGASRWTNYSVALFLGLGVSGGLFAWYLSKKKAA